MWWSNHMLTNAQMRGKVGDGIWTDVDSAAERINAVTNKFTVLIPSKQYQVGKVSHVILAAQTHNRLESGPWEHDPREWFTLDVGSVAFVDGATVPGWTADSSKLSMAFRSLLAAEKAWEENTKEGEPFAQKVSADGFCPIFSAGQQFDSSIGMKRWLEKQISQDKRRAKAHAAAQAKRPTAELSNADFAKIFQQQIKS
jgi:hypothetical protein